MVDLLHLLRHDVHSGDMVVLAQQGGDGQADIACARNGNVQFFRMLSWLSLLRHNYKMFGGFCFIVS